MNRYLFFFALLTVGFASSLHAAQNALVCYLLKAGDFSITTDFEQRADLVIKKLNLHDSETKSVTEVVIEDVRKPIALSNLTTSPAQFDQEEDKTLGGINLMTRYPTSRFMLAIAEKKGVPVPSDIGGLLLSEYGAKATQASLKLQMSRDENEPGLIDVSLATFYYEKGEKEVAGLSINDPHLNLVVADPWITHQPVFTAISSKSIGPFPFGGITLLCKTQSIGK